MTALKRELIILLIIVVTTIFLLFPATYFVGVKTFGEYGDGSSLVSYLASLFSALLRGDPGIWFFTLTPLISISLLRFGIFAFRRL